MNGLLTIVILATAYLAVFLEASGTWLARFLGAQVDLLPALMVYAALTAELPTMLLLAFLGGLWFDCLSANPAGVSILPLLAIGLVIQQNKFVLLREELFAQTVLGLGASALAPVLSAMVLLSLGHEPIIGVVSIWQWMVMTLLGGACTPVLFKLLDSFRRAITYQPSKPVGFREDREIKRSRM
jgi:rod shape-determining protein MreD